jgi:hypothetical protein
VTEADTRQRLLRRACRVALCYIVALQTFLAAYGAAMAASQVGETGSGFIICHGADASATPNPVGRSGPQLPCLFCVLAAAASALPPGTSLILAIVPKLSDRPRPFGVAVLARLSPWRATLARPPPSFA